jgi:septal ring-binding cell division protein DamX
MIVQCLFRVLEFKFESKAAKKYKRQQSNCLNKYYNKTVSNPYFLTRQTANLMEDFTRELNQGPALFLLYGENGVGKTRLLQELSETRLSERAIYWINLDSEDGSDATRMDRSAEVEALFAAAGNGDIIIADHFEMALKKTRHQLFLSWSTDGIDKQLHLIITSSTEGFNEFRQLSQQYQVRVQSFQQMPLSADEVQAFLGFHLFPDHPMGKLTIPPPLGKQIAAAQGVIGNIVEIADREGTQIKSAPIVETESIRQGSRIIVSLLILSVLAVGIGWYLTRQNELFEAPAVAAVESSKVTDAEIAVDTEIAAAPEDESVEAAEPAGAAIGETTVVPVPVVPETDAANETAAMSDPVAAENGMLDSTDTVEAVTAIEAETAAVDAVDDSEVVANQSEVLPKAEPETVAVDAMDNGESVAMQSGVALEAEPGTASDSEAVIDESIVIDQSEPAQSAGDDVAGQLALPQSSQQRFELELKQSMGWLQKHGDTVGTIQIMLLSFENFDPDNYYDYVDKLARKQVDPERLHVFKTLTGNREVYSVVYGEFASRRSAIGAIDSLPVVLRDTAPLARSVGGLWQEIRRLESNN